MMLLCWPVGDDAVTAALPVGDRGVAEQLVLARVQGNQQVNHKAGVVDGLAEHGAFLILHQLLLLLFAQAGPRTQLFRCQVHGCVLLISARCWSHILERLKQTAVWEIFFFFFL